MLKADTVSVSGGALGLVVTNLPRGELRDPPDNVFCEYFARAQRVPAPNSCGIGGQILSQGVQTDPSPEPMQLCQFAPAQGVILPANGTSKLNLEFTSLISKWPKHGV